MQLKDMQSIASIPDLVPPKVAVRGADDAAERFEAVFVGEIFKAMRATVSESNQTFGKSICTSMLDEELAQAVAKSDALGLASMLRGEMQEKHLKI